MGHTDTVLAYGGSTHLPRWSLEAWRTMEKGKINWSQWVATFLPLGVTLLIAAFWVNTQLVAVGVGLESQKTAIESSTRQLKELMAERNEHIKTRFNAVEADVNRLDQSMETLSKEALRFYRDRSKITSSKRGG